MRGWLDVLASLFMLQWAVVELIELVRGLSRLR